MDSMRPLVRATDVRPLEAFRVRVTFEEGTSRDIDLAPYLHGPIFQPIRNDPTMFRSVRIDGGALTWDNGADIDPDVLYYSLTPAWMEEQLASDHR